MNARMRMFLMPALLLGVQSCGPEDILSNAGMDLWCGDELCGWELEQGDVAKVATWHPHDYGVQLIGDEVVLSQVAQVTSAEVACIRFDLLADMDDDVEIMLEMDFLDDGSTEYEHPLISDDWQEVSYHIRPPTWFHDIRFRIRKLGSGDAVLAQVRALEVSADNCQGDAIVLDDRPLGAVCEEASQCDAGFCEGVPWLSSQASTTVLSCGECASGEDCPDDEACGLGAGDEPQRHLECGGAGRHYLGETCAFDEECASGICCEGSCSECCDDGRECADGAACARRVPAELDEYLMGSAAPDVFQPFMCGGGLGDRAAGEPCLSLGDCQSGDCRGLLPLGLCDPDGRSCQEDDDCPGENATCWMIGFEYGVCAE